MAGRIDGIDTNYQANQTSTENAPARGEAAGAVVAPRSISPTEAASSETAREFGIGGAVNTAA